jgi:hypothetical protein
VKEREVPLDEPAWAPDTEHEVAQLVGHVLAPPASEADLGHVLVEQGDPVAGVVEALRPDAREILGVPDHVGQH